MTTGTLSQATRLDRFAAALAAGTGLTVGASRTWARAEVGGYNNLGIMSGGHPVRFATPEEGAAAAAALINRSSLYAPIRATVGQSEAVQLAAIERSPWHLGPSGLRKAGGVDPYYARIFGTGDAVKPAAPTFASAGKATIDAATTAARSLASRAYPSLMPKVELGPSVAAGLTVGPSMQAATPVVSSAPASVAQAAPSATVAYDPIGLAILAGAAVLVLLVLTRGRGAEATS